MWVGAFGYFTHSDNWRAVQRIIASDPTVTASVGTVRDVSPHLTGFSWNFSGQRGAASVRVSVKGQKADRRFRVEVEERNGRWTIRAIHRL